MLYSGCPHTIYDVLHSITYGNFWSSMCTSRINAMSSSYSIMDTNTLCDKCKKNEIQIYNEYGDCCIPCWYEMTEPRAS